jgi:hypothetical protein
MTNSVIKHTVKFTRLNSICYFLSVVFACLFYSSASYANNLLTDEFETNQFMSKLSLKLNMNEDDVTSKSILKQGRFVGFSHKFSQLLGIDLSLDTYLYTSPTDNSFRWIVGVVTDLFIVNYKTDQTTQHDRIEFISNYPLNETLRLKGYASSQQDGKDQFKDYSVGIAYSFNSSLEISAGYADRELKKVETQSNVFVNISGVF